ncbi:hypothetical protein M422DRAFT_116623, partial [Sphaerobolus stellatus SS14]
ADIFNDSAMILDCLSPALPKQIRVVALCFSGSLRALCGVAAGGAKAALSIHFAKANNVGDLNAKDSSQETVIGLLGMLAGSFVVSHVTSRGATWIFLILLIAIHLATNYLAVRAVTMNSFNRQRLSLVYSSYRRTGIIDSPRNTSKRERIFTKGGRLFDETDTNLGFCDIGSSFSLLFQENNRQRSILESSRLADLFTLYANEKYIL